MMKVGWGRDPDGRRDADDIGVEIHSHEDPILMFS
jgi:hypothetical protein